MSTFFIFFLTSTLLGICAFTVLLILMQRPSEESGMGATLGGGAATSVFGGEAVNILAKITKYCVIIFFILSFILSMLHLALEKTDKPQNLLEKREIGAVVTEEVQEKSENGITPDKLGYKDISENITALNAIVPENDMIPNNLDENVFETTPDFNIDIPENENDYDEKNEEFSLKSI